VKADGTPIATPAPTADYALRFDGNSKVDVPTTSLAADKPFTFEAWATPDSADIGKQASIIAVPNVIALRTNFTGGAWWFSMPGGSVSATTIKAGLGSKRPHHLAGVSTGKEILLFVDGKLVERKNSNAESLQAAKNIVLGENWRGLIDEVRISKVARYDKDFTPLSRFEPDKDTIALYHFDEGQGDKLTDSSGNNHHGKIVGAKWVKANDLPDIDRAAAAWLLGNGSFAGIRVNCRDTPVKSAADLPGERFEVVTINVNRNRLADDENLACLNGLRHVQFAQITNCPATDKTLEYIKNCTELRTLILYNSRVTDAGLDTIAGFKNLRQLNLTQLPISETAVKKLAAAIPQCRIAWSGSTIEPTVRSALAFDGTSAYVEIPSLSRDDDHPITIEALVIVNGVGGANVVRIEGKSPCQMHGWPAKDAAKEWVPNGMDQRGVKCFGATPSLQPGKRTHVAVQIDEKAVQLFVDGKKVNAAARKAGPGDGSLTGTLLGAGMTNGRNTPSAFFSGTLAEVRISKTARYKDNFTPQLWFETDPETLALYHFDEGQGDKLTDSSGNNHHGKIVGAKWVKADGTPLESAATSGFALRYEKGNKVDVPSLLPKLPKAGPLTIEAYVTPAKGVVGMSRKYITTVGVKSHFVIGMGSPGHKEVWNLEAAGAKAIYGPEESGNQRRHVAGVRSANKTLLFLDGKLVGESAVDPLEEPKGFMFNIGGGLFVGQIDQVRVSTSARYVESFIPPARFALDADTLALYHFDEGSGDKLTDSSGNGHHGKIVGAKWVKADGTAITPTVQALRLDGYSKVEAQSLSLQNTPNATIEAYVTPLRNDFTKATHVVGVEQQFSLWINANSKPNVWDFGLDKPDSYFNLEPAAPLIPGRQVHLAGVREGNQMRLYVDGKLVGSREVPPGALREGNLLYFGESTDVLFSTMHLSKKARYNKDFTPAKRFEPDADTLALFRFDEAQGDVLPDSSGNGRHGKIVDAKWVKVDAPPTLTATEYALKFQGAGEYVGTSALKVALAKPWTYEGWVTPLQAPPEMDSTIIMGGAEIGFSLFNREKLGGLRWRAYAVGQEAVKGLPGYNSDQPVILGQKVHLAMVHDGAFVRFYVNGVPQGKALKFSGTDEEVGFNPGPSLWSSGGGRPGFHGLLHSVRLSFTARYKETFSPDKRFEPDKDTLALYRLDEGSGEKLTDSSGNGHHGKIVGAKWVKADETPITPASGKAVDAERDAAEWVLAIGGSVIVRDLKNKSTTLKPGAALPEDKFQITRVDLPKTNELTQNGFAKLAVLPEMTFFYAGHTNLDDAMLAQIRDWRGVTQLDIRQCPIGDGVWPLLASMAKLNFVELSDTKVTGRGAGVVKDVPIKQLRVWSSGVNDAGWPELAALNVEFLDIDGAVLSDKAVQSLAESKSVKKLMLRFPNKASLAQIPRLTKLRPLDELHLSGSGLAPKDLEVLAGAGAIGKLRIGNCPGLHTEAVYRRLSELLPKTEIWDDAKKISLPEGRWALRFDAGATAEVPSLKMGDADPLCIEGYVRLHQIGDKAYSSMVMGYWQGTAITQSNPAPPNGS